MLQTEPYFVVVLQRDGRRILQGPGVEKDASVLVAYRHVLVVLVLQDRHDRFHPESGQVDVTTRIAPHFPFALADEVDQALRQPWVEVQGHELRRLAEAHGVAELAKREAPILEHLLAHLLATLRVVQAFLDVLAILRCQGLCRLQLGLGLQAPLVVDTKVGHLPLQQTNLRLQGLDRTLLVDLRCLHPHLLGALGKLQRTPCLLVVSG
mmetsp:Transcript_16831/g.48170  ORF Transcript_16831/g.48170 Transcript_16831/m.48170 type:complete len:209 (+) Transcript_16831:275-901(+)